MSEERRGSRRSPLSGVRVTYENAGGTPIEAEVLDLASGGLFVRTDAPLAVGKRIAVDIHVVGEPAPWAALGRVVWARAEGEAGRPAGMGVKLIDVDDATLASIERLVETREPTAPGVGEAKAAVPGAVPPIAPERERTLLGVAPPSEPPAAMPDAPPAETVPRAPKLPAREPGAPVLPSLEPEDEPAPDPARASAPSREQSVAIDLVAHKPSKPAPSPSRPPPGDTGAGAGRWVVILLLLVVAGIAAYVLVDGFLTPLGK